MAVLVLKQIEANSVSFLTTDASITVTLATTLTDTSKTILLFSVQGVSIQPATFCWTGRIISTTQIQFDRNTASGTGTIEYQVIEFTQGIYVQHFYTAMSSSPTDVTISAIDLTKTFVICTVNANLAGWNTRHFVKADLTTTTNLQLSSVNPPVTVATQVIQIDNATVQKITDTMGTGATKDVTVTTIDPAKTFWVFTANTTGATAVDNSVYLSYVNTTTLRFTRVAASGIDFPFILFVVSLSSGVTVQNVSTVIASGNTTVSPTIPNTITVAQTALLINGFYQRFSSVNDTNDDAGEAQLTVGSLTTTDFTAIRASNPALSATTNVQVLSFSTSGAVEIFEPRTTGRGIMCGIGRGIM